MPLVTITILQFSPGDRYRAFANMGRWMMTPFSVPGLTFQKMLGTGRNFRAWPDFSRYVFLSVWQSETQAQAFFGSEQWRPFLPKEHPTPSQSAEPPVRTLYLQPIKSHGLWDGVDPFQGIDSNVPASLSPDTPIAVLTRASIRTGALLDFWRNVPAASQPLHEQGNNLLLAVGAGEKPLVQQCTISVWRNAAAVDQFAYRQRGHKEIVKKTRQRRWYTEELFARFWVIKTEGMQ